MKRSLAEYILIACGVVALVWTCVGVGLVIWQTGGAL